MRLFNGIAVSILITLSSAAIFAEAAPKLLFHASYDKSLSADKARGNGNPNFSLGEVNYETLHTYLKPGIVGQALHAGIMAQGKNAPRAQCVYKAAGNLDYRQGGLSLWVKPVDWEVADKQYHIFFAASSQDSLMMVYQFMGGTDLLFLYGPRAKGADGQYQWTVARASIKDWKSGDWHMLACNWDSKKLSLYIDGKLRGKADVITPAPSRFDAFAVGDILGDTWKGTAGSSLLDELKIYGTPLSEDAVVTQWEKLNQNHQADVLMRLPARTATIDGKIAPGEYSFASTGFFNLDGVMSPTQGRYALAYDDRWIYLAVQTPTLDSPLTAQVTQRDGPVYRDDSVEFYLQPQEAGPWYQVVINSQKAVYDAKLEDASWNLKSLPRIASRVDRGQWTLEVAIPIGAKGIPMNPRDGAWRVNLCRTYAQPRDYLSAAPVKKTFNDVKRFIRVHPEVNAPAIDIQSLGQLDQGQLNLVIPTATDQPIWARVKLTMDHQVALDETIKPDAKGTLRVTRDQGSSSGSTDSGGALALRLMQPGQIEPIYRARFAFGHAVPLEVRYVTTDLHRKVALAAIRYQAELDGALPLTIKLTDPKTHVVVAQAQQVPTQRVYMLELPIGDVPPGDYRLSVESSPNASVYAIDYQIPTDPAPWVGNSLGQLNKVPDPWTPVRVNASEVHVWGRSIDMAQNVFPSQINTQGQNLLSAPIRLVVGDTPLTLKMTESQQVHHDALAAEITSCATAKGLDVRTVTRIEYDGFIWITLILKANKPCLVSSLAMEIPLRSKQSTLIHELAKGYEFLRTTSGNLPDQGWQKNLFKKPIFWVGNEDVGLQWFAQTLEGWSVRNENQSVQAIRDTPLGDTILRLNLIDHPVTLRGTRTIAFGLMPTPVRPRLKEWRKIRVGTNITAWLPYTKLFNYPGRDQLVENDAYARSMVARSDPSVAAYHAFYMTSPLSPQWPYWSSLWRSDPPAQGQVKQAQSDPRWVSTHVSAASKNYRDFYLWKLNEGIEAYGIKSLYFDHGVPRMDKNTEHGSGWIDENGRVRESYNILGTRELARRIYILLKQRSPRGLILNHMSEEPAMPVLAYADAMIDGELYCKQVAQDRSYYNVFRPDLFRAQFMSRQWGPISVFIPQFTRGSQAFDNDSINFWDTPQARKPLNHFVGYILVHDAKVWPIFGVDMTDVYRAQDAFGWDDAMTFIPYWQHDSSLQRIGAEPDDESIMVSAYVKPTRVMVVLLNDTDRDVSVSIKVDTRRLGLRKTPTQASDAISNKKVSWNHSVLKVTLPAREFRMIVLK